ncbi:chemotaxis protein CheB [Chryseobacterium sp. POL2]|uniref:chemotaxis protein CheB n=1 Tax=Chryseobacterium sp. POL2 TaxID=2713414 RepID=UPI0013E13308|nr:chemotaxis protein CheB [Chryseobacterium sp. POL2]QIG88777.1 chemotaxis protein CheB [Chryseobacterium sp. POL2]
MNEANTELVIIGGSAGSLQVILEMIKKLDIDLGFPMVLVVHRKAQSTSLLPILMTQISALKVKEVEDKTELDKKCIYIAPADYHLLFESKNKVSLDASEKVNYSRPSIDVSFKSAAETFGKNVVAILLSGANADGTEGLEYIKKNKGKVWIQNPDTAEVDYMPKQAIRNVEFDCIFEAEDLAQKINRLKYIH